MTTRKAGVRPHSQGRELGSGSADRIRRASPCFQTWGERQKTALVIRPGLYLQYFVSFKSNRNFVYSCKYHLVFCPKYRRRVLLPPIDGRLKEIIRETCMDARSEL
jgi:hypothetical protein